MLDDNVDSDLLVKVRPPYVAFKTFETFLQRLAREDIPARVDSSLLKRWRIAAGNESALVTSLKSLSLIDADGRPTNEYREMRLSIPRQQAALRRCAERAYAGLDTPVEAEIGADQLHDCFVAKRGLHGQMVDKAMRFFRGLEEALRGATTTRAPIEPPIRISHTAATSTPQATATAPLSSADSLTLALTVQVPFDATEAELADFIRRVRQAWRQSTKD